MIGYLNAPSPFDQSGWYCTKDIVEVDDQGYITIVGRDSDVINIGGLKFMPSQVEQECINIVGVKFAKACGVANPITGHYLSLFIESTFQDDTKNADLKSSIMDSLRKKLPPHMIPLKITIQKQNLSHRFKRI